MDRITVIAVPCCSITTIGGGVAAAAAAAAAVDGIGVGVARVCFCIARLRFRFRLCRHIVPGISSLDPVFSRGICDGQDGIPLKQTQFDVQWQSQSHPFALGIETIHIEQQHTPIIVVMIIVIVMLVILTVTLTLIVIVIAMKIIRLQWPRSATLGGTSSVRIVDGVAVTI